MKTRLLYIGIGLLAAFAASAQKKSPIDFTPTTCIRAGELGLLQMSVAEKGELRAYFRRINTTDWCSVEGVNEGPLSRIVLPKFETGDDIEYFVVLIDGRRVVARSPRIFRAHVSEECQSPFARHVLKIALSCGDDATGIPSSMGAGYSVKDTVVRGNPPVPSPDRPVQQQQPQ